MLRPAKRCRLAILERSHAATVPKGSAFYKVGPPRQRKRRLARWATPKLPVRGRRFAVPYLGRRGMRSSSNTLVQRSRRETT